MDLELVKSENRVYLSDWRLKQCLVSAEQKNCLFSNIAICLNIQDDFDAGNDDDDVARLMSLCKESNRRIARQVRKLS